MSLWKIAWRSIQQRALSSALTAFSISLGVALVVAVLVIHSTVQQAFTRGAQGYNMIVGAKGGQLPLVLSTVFYLQLNQPLDSFPYSEYERLTTGETAGVIQAAVPICLGHDFKGCPAVATTSKMFEDLKYGEGKTYEWSEGGNFNDDHPFEAVVGASAARKTGLKVGDKFEPVATGPEGASGHAAHEPFVVTGILAPTDTPNDQAVFLNIEGFFRCPAHAQGPSDIERDLSQVKCPKCGHLFLPSFGVKPEKAGAKPESQADEHSDHDHDEHEHARRLTAILICTDVNQDPVKAMHLLDDINRRPLTQAVYPMAVIENFFKQIVGNVQLLLLILAVLVVIVAGIGILVSIYNSMNDRRHDIAVVRALGASRGIVMTVILLESILLALGGGLLGLLLGHSLTGALGPIIAKELGVTVSALEFRTVELLLVPGLIVLATLVGYLPAAVAYRTDVAKSLQAGT